MKRQVFITLLGSSVLWPLAGRAQNTGTKPRIGFLGNSSAALESNLVTAFRDGLREFGYEDGRNIDIDYRWAEGNYELFSTLAAELVAQRVAVIVTAGTPAVLAAKNTTQSVPIVMVAVGDPLGTGVVKSLARPGGNVTGLSSIAPELEGKRLELLKEVLPHLRHIAVLWNSENPFHQSALQRAQDAANALRIKVLALDVRNAAELDSAFGAIVEKQPEALLVLADRLFLHDRKRLVEFL